MYAEYVCTHIHLHSPIFPDRCCRKIPVPTRLRKEQRHSFASGPCTVLTGAGRDSLKQSGKAH